MACNQNMVYLLIAVLFLVENGFSFEQWDDLDDPSLYHIGVGIADVTGPAADINMMGYAKIAQVTKGIHIRQYSRAFVISDNSSRVVIISVDAGMVSHVVKMEICGASPVVAVKYQLQGLKTARGTTGFDNTLLYNAPSESMARLQKDDTYVEEYRKKFHCLSLESDLCTTGIPRGRFTDGFAVSNALREKFGDMYSEENILLTATHTHATPGGYLQYLLYLIPSQGFIKQTFTSLVQGIVRSVERAHVSVQPGYIYWNQGELQNASINRSPTAYVNNPQDEREQYDDNVDRTMFLLKFTDINDKPLGMINWFAVHPTNMNSSNHLISGDNKGVASLMFEEEMNGNALPGKGPFVAAFAQSNAGDVSPNILGPRCPSDPKEKCDIESSTCRNGKERCIAVGPGKDMFESTKIIGSRQYEKAMELFDTAEEKLYGPVLHIHQYIDMSNIEVSNNESVRRTTCKPAMGYSFAAGTTDCPGEFDFLQGTTKSSALWNFVVNFIRRPSRELKQCHLPKPILLATGEMSLPYKWQPDIIPTQILKMGQLAILAVPAEVTTMAGRRMRNAVKRAMDESNYHSTDNLVVLAALSNAYSSYIATFEEYQVQRYEGASTLYGPYTLEAYIRQFEMLADNMLLRHDVDHGLEPANLLGQQISFKLNVMFDGLRRGRKFGDVIQDVLPEYKVGSTVLVSFVSGHPRNDMMLEKTFLTVEKRNDETKEWDVIANDASWDTKFIWQRTNTLIAESMATIIWDIPLTARPGKYRIRHFGNSKNILQVVKPFIGTSGEFKVLPP